MNGRRINGLKRPLAMALAAALIATSAPASTVSASAVDPGASEAPAEVPAEEAEETMEEILAEAPEEAPEEAKAAFEEKEEAPAEEEALKEEAEEAPKEEAEEPSEGAPAEEEAPKEEAEEAPVEEPSEETPVEEEAPKEEAEEAPAEEPSEETPAEEEAPKEEAEEAPAEEPGEEAPAEEEAPREGTEEDVLEALTEEEESGEEMGAEEAAGSLAKVKGLRLDTKVDGVVDNSKLSWDNVQGAEDYEIRLTDASGREYAASIDEEDSKKLSYWSVDEECPYDLGHLIRNYQAYQKKTDGTYEAALADGNPIYAVKGGSYKVYVRAVNSRVAGSYGYETGYGEWSDGLDITMPGSAKAEKLTNVELRADGNDARNPKISFTLGEENDYAEVEIKDAQNRYYYPQAPETDSNGAEKYTYVQTRDEFFSLNKENNNLYVWQKNESGYYEQVLDAQDNPIQAFETGQTYTIRLRGVVGGASPAYSDWSEAITYQVAENGKPEATGNVKYDPEEGRLTWNSSKDAEGYEIELKDGTVSYNSYPESHWDESQQKWVYDLSEYIVWNDGWYEDEDENRPCQDMLTPYYKWILGQGGEPEKAKDAKDVEYEACKPGTTYTVRIRAYNYKKGLAWNEKVSNARQYSDWTSVYTFTIPADQAAPGKVAGLKVGPESVRWDKEANADKLGLATTYQIEIKDADGRIYGQNPAKEDGTWYADGVNYYSTGETRAPIKSFWDEEEEDYTGLNRLYTYTADKDGTGKVAGYVPVVHTSGRYANKNMRAFEAGKTYTVRVRAMRTYDGKAVFGEWSDAATYAVPAERVEGIQGVPEKVTGLVLKTDNEKDDQEALGGAELRWNKLDNVSKYEFEIKDSKGNLYSEGLDPTNSSYAVRYISTEDEEGNVSSWPLSSLSGKMSYVKAAGSAVDTVKNAAGAEAKTFEAGETYTIRVRAVNVCRTWNADKNDWNSADYNYGEWSDAVSYKPAATSALTGLQYVKVDEDNYYFTYKGELNSSAADVYYQIATDANFSSASKVGGWTKADTSRSLLAIHKGTQGLEPGTTYFVRAVNYAKNSKKTIDELTDAEIAKLSPAVASFTTEALKQPKNITGLKLYKENRDSFEFRFDAVLREEDGDEFELQVNQNPNDGNWSAVNHPNDGNWSAVDLWDEDGEARIYKSQLNEGTTYVRARAYVWQENQLTGREEKVYGNPSNVVAVTIDRATSSIHSLKLKEQTDNEFVLGFSGTVDKRQYVEYQYSDSRTFDTNQEYDTYTSEEEMVDEVNGQFSIPFRDLTAGKKYYVRARVVNDNAKSDAEKYGAYTNVVTIAATIPTIEVRAAKVSKNSITLTAETANDEKYLSGFEIQRKDGKAWKDVAKTSDSTYTDTKLEANTTYSYRARPYFYNSKTESTTNGAWAYTEGTTWGAALKLKAEAASKTSVKLSWSKVSDAEGYEIYRCVGSYDDTEISGGKGNGFSQFKLVKSVKAKTKAYTDKKLTEGMDYIYRVVAYKTLDGSRVTIQEDAGVTLSWKLRIASTVRKANGTVVWSWNPVYGAKGYLVEVRDRVTDKWSTFKKISKAKTKSITLPKTDDSNGVEYRVRAYNGSKYTNAEDTKVYPVLAAPRSVKAKASAKSGSITVTWKKVNGADYYKVYRTTDSYAVYNKDKNDYASESLTEVPMYVEDSTRVSGYRRATEKDMDVARLVDKDITYTANGVTNTIYEGPRTGVTYYYYVVAYKNGTAYNYDEGVYEGNYGDATYDGEPYIEGLCSKAASAVLKSTNAPKKATLSSVKAAKNKVTVKYKKVAGAKGYDILRSTNKKKGFEVVGTVTGAKKVSYVDKKSSSNVLKKGTTYYYKVQAFTYNEAGLKEYGKASAVKQVKAK